MNHDKFERKESGRQSTGMPVEVENKDRSDTIIEQVSAQQYERRNKSRTGFRQSNGWIAVGLYLVLAGMAMVIF